MKILLEEKILGTHSKKSSRYYWILETVTAKQPPSDQGNDFEATSSEKGYIQDIKAEIIEKMNSENVFSFPYTPKEGDYLAIKNNLRKFEYLNLIFINDKWIEEIFPCSYRECDTDMYSTLKTGVAFFSDSVA